MIRRPPRTTRTDTLFPYTTLFRSNEPVIGNLQEGGDRGRFVILARRPGRHLAERRNDGIVGCEEEVTPTCLGPVGEIIAGAHQFIADFLYRSEEHTSELQSLIRISYPVFCLKKKKPNTIPIL